MATRTRRKVGKPTAAVMWRIWRFFPSRSTMRSQVVGPCGVTGLARVGRSGSGTIMTWLRRVIRPFTS
ncbi:MAG: hypothetical protein EHM21_02650, partial [Chloroflexi bacterium]